MKTFKQHGEGSLEGNLEQKIQKLFQGLFLSILDPAAQDGEGGGKMVFHDVVTLPELGFVTLIIPGQVGDLANGDLADIFLFIELQECFLEIFFVSAVRCSFLFIVKSFLLQRPLQNVSDR